MARKELGWHSRPGESLSLGAAAVSGKGGEMAAALGRVGNESYNVVLGRKRQGGPGPPARALLRKPQASLFRVGLGYVCMCVYKCCAVCVHLCRSTRHRVGVRVCKHAMHVCTSMSVCTCVVPM